MLLLAEAENWVAQILTSLAALATALVPILVWITTLQRKTIANKESVDTMWKGLLRRGAVEAEQKGLTENTVDRLDEPMALKSEVRKAYEPIAPCLRYLRHTQKPQSDTALAELIEKEYGAWLIRHICIPLRVHDTACLRMALDVSKEPGMIVATKPDSWEQKANGI